MAVASSCRQLPQVTSKREFSFSGLDSDCPRQGRAAEEQEMQDEEEGEEEEPREVDEELADSDQDSAGAASMVSGLIRRNPSESESARQTHPWKRCWEWTGRPTSLMMRWSWTPS